MAKKRRKLPLLENVTFSGNVSMGRAVTRIDDVVLFVEGAVPGDVADVQVTKKKKNFMEGRLVKLHTPSSLRTKPACVHFGICGGCKWQHLDYQAQLRFKAGEVYDNLERIGGLDLPGKTEALPSASVFRYRNKLDFAFASSRWLTREEIDSGMEFEKNVAGFHPAGRFDKVIDIDECLLQPEPSNRYRNRIKQFARQQGMSFYNPVENKGFLRNLILRNTLAGEFMLMIIFGEALKEQIEPVIDFIVSEFPELSTILYAINTKKNDSIYDLDFITVKGDGYITETMEDLSFRISPKSFYQTNPSQAYQLYSIVRELAALTGTENVYDLYTGTGTIAAFIGKQAARVTGVEFVEDAVRDARINASINGMDNLYFEAGDLRHMLNDEFVARHGRPDIVITDPPRAGMHEDVVHAILKLEPRSIVYVSCNPASQARDLSLLKSKYRLTDIRPVDMFPHTYHIENVVRLERAL